MASVRKYKTAGCLLLLWQRHCAVSSRDLYFQKCNTVGNLTRSELPSFRGTDRKRHRSDDYFSWTLSHHFFLCLALSEALYAIVYLVPMADKTTFLYFESFHHQCHASHSGSLLYYQCSSFSLTIRYRKMAIAIDQIALICNCNLSVCAVTLKGQLASPSQNCALLLDKMPSAMHSHESFGSGGGGQYSAAENLERV